MKNKFPKMHTPRFRHPHGKGWPLNGKNRAQRQRLIRGTMAMKGMAPEPINLLDAVTF